MLQNPGLSSGLLGMDNRYVHVCTYTVVSFFSLTQEQNAALGHYQTNLNDQETLAGYRPNDLYMDDTPPVSHLPAHDQLDSKLEPTLSPSLKSHIPHLPLQLLLSNPEVYRLFEQHNKLLSDKLSLAENLLNVERESANLKVAVVKLEGKLEELQAQLDDAKMRIPFSP